MSSGFGGRKKRLNLPVPPVQPDSWFGIDPEGGQDQELIPCASVGNPFENDADLDGIADVRVVPPSPPLLATILKASRPVCEIRCPIGHRSRFGRYRPSGREGFVEESVVARRRTVFYFRPNLLDHLRAMLC